MGLEVIWLIVYAFFTAMFWQWSSVDFEEGENVRGFIYLTLSALNGGYLLHLLV